MKLYFTRSRYVEELDTEVHDNCAAFTVFEPDTEPYDTGLINKDGNPIMAQFKFDQIGYVRR